MTSCQPCCRCGLCFAAARLAILNSILKNCAVSPVRDPVLLPLARGAWLLMSRPKSLDSRRFFQLSADGASLRWCVAISDNPAARALVCPSCVCPRLAYRDNVWGRSSGRRSFFPSPLLTSPTRSFSTCLSAHELDSLELDFVTRPRVLVLTTSGLFPADQVMVQLRAPVLRRRARHALRRGQAVHPAPVPIGPDLTLTFFDRTKCAALILPATLKQNSTSSFGVTCLPPCMSDTDPDALKQGLLWAWLPCP